MLVVLSQPKQTHPTQPTSPGLALLSRSSVPIIPSRNPQPAPADLPPKGSSRALALEAQSDILECLHQLQLDPAASCTESLPYSAVFMPLTSKPYSQLGQELTPHTSMPTTVATRPVNQTGQKPAPLTSIHKVVIARPSRQLHQETAPHTSLYQSTQIMTSHKREHTAYIGDTPGLPSLGDQGGLGY